MIEIASALIMALFPIAYAFHHRVQNRVLFLFASFGFVAVLSVLWTLALVPIFILGIYVFPEVQDSGIAIEWTFLLMEAVSGPVFAILSALLGIVGPVLVLRRYSAIFLSAARHD
jgi:hypothetical protein